MADISSLSIPSTSNTTKSASDYKNYLIAYRSFSNQKNKFAPKSTVKLDSQFSECLAADYFSFRKSAKKHFDGYRVVAGKKEYYEVKGTGFNNNRVSFNPVNQADHVIWIKATSTEVEIREINNAIYNSLPKVAKGKRASITLDAYLKKNQKVLSRV